MPAMFFLTNVMQSQLINWLHLERGNVFHDFSASTKIELRNIDNGPVEVLGALQGSDPGVDDDHRVKAAGSSAPPKPGSRPQKTRGHRVVGPDADPTWVVHQ